MKVYIHSCHAVLEYDQARMFVKMGCEVAGRFDLGSTQRPKIEGVTDVNDRFAPGDADVLVLHQTGTFPIDAAKYARTGIPVVAMAFGQGCPEQHAALAMLVNRGDSICVCAYSNKEWTTYNSHGVSDERLRLIRFGKRLSEHGPWIGDWPMIYCAHNAVQRRGEACGFHILEQLAGLVPIIVSGRETEVISNGLGEVTLEAQANLFRHARGYLTLGTKPAPMTLSPIEAACHGCPVVAYDNGCGIAGEQTGWVISSDVGDLSHDLHYLANSRNDVYAASVKDKAAAMFSEELAAEKWGDLLRYAATLKG